MSVKKEKFRVADMTCSSCEKRIERELKKQDGIINVIASYEGSSVLVEYDDALCSSSKVKASIEKAGYTVGENSEGLSLAGILLIGLAIFYLGNSTNSFNMNAKLQEGTTMFVLFVVGLFTSIHCVGMCGGIMLSQSISTDSTSKLKALKPTLLYNLGRVISYTILGGIVGAIGSVLSISIYAKAGISIFAGLFMVIMGLNMTGLSPFKKLSIKMPWSFCTVKTKTRAPFIVGLLNGLLPCGPLQTMQLYALGTGSFAKGALSMFIFALGTVPLMLTFGMITGFLTKGYTKKILKFSGFLVLFLGITMANRGLALAGIRPLTPRSITSAFSPEGNTAAGTSSAAKAEIKDGVQILHMTADSKGYTPNVLFIQKGIPVKWIIDGKQVTSCNGQVVIPSLNIQKNLQSGENEIDFTPSGSSDINFSCWMGMINGVIKVVDNLGTYDTSKADVSVAPSSGMSCCGGGAPAPSKPSIYGNDINKVPTSRLVLVAHRDGNDEVLNIKGIGYEFEPLVLVTKTNIKTNLNYDLKAFDKPKGVFSIVNYDTGAMVATGENTKSNFTLSCNFKKASVYGVIKDGQLINLIKVVNSTDNLDLNAIRNEFLQQ